MGDTRCVYVNHNALNLLLYLQTNHSVVKLVFIVILLPRVEALLYQ